MELICVEGNRQRLDGGAMFGNVPRALWSRWLAPDELNRVELATRGLLVPDLAGHTVLFETGIGAFFEPKLRERYGVLQSRHVLLDSLAAAGYPQEQIDIVVLSHLHFDHAGGLLGPWVAGSGPRLLFPNARYLVGRKAWERACHPHPRDRASFIPELPGLLAASGRLELVDGEQHELLGDRVRFHFSDGHTPGLMMAEIGARVLFCSDLIPGTPWVHLPVTMGYDRHPELLIDEKRRVLEHVIANGLRLFFEHDPDCIFATVERDERGRYVARCLASA